MAHTDPLYMTRRELADRWRCTPGAIAQRHYRGEAPPCIRIGVRVLYRLADVEAFEAAREERPAA